MAYLDIVNKIHFFTHCQTFCLFLFVGTHLGRMFKRYIGNALWGILRVTSMSQFTLSGMTIWIFSFGFKLNSVCLSFLWLSNQVLFESNTKNRDETIILVGVMWERTQDQTDQTDYLVHRWVCEDTVTPYGESEEGKGSFTKTTNRRSNRRSILNVWTHAWP